MAMTSIPRSRRPRYAIRALLYVVPLLAAVALILLNRQPILDWRKLRGYSAPSAVVSLAQDTTMTNYGEHLFYVNRPSVTTGSSFTKNCSVGSEKTIILGCYKSGDRGIYLYKVSDTRLQGVIEVTAAHEMLHAAYARLSSTERTSLNAMLKDYYEHSLTDQRIKDTIAAYKQSEPTELYNEMHSIFGTEVASLPPNLEAYYTRYFTDRAKVVAYAAGYQSEFTSRKNQIVSYDAQLKGLKQTIEANEADISAKRTALNAQLELVNSGDSSGTTAAQINNYNVAVATYNNLLQETRDAIDNYNAIVDKRNAIVLEEQQLAQSLSPQSLPAAQ